MTRQQAQELMDLWQVRLGLSHFELILETDKDLGNSYAECRRAPSYNRAVVRLAPWLFHKKPQLPKNFLPMPVTDERIEKYLVHELLHIVLKNYQTIIDDDLDGVVQRDVHAQLINAMDRVNENTIDSLAVALVNAWHKEK